MNPKHPLLSDRSNWQFLTRPDVLFGMGAVQAILPQIIWICGGGSVDSRFKPSFEIVLMWLIGYTCFWLGTRIVGKRSGTRGYESIPISIGFLKMLIALLGGSCVLELYALTKVYGAIPLLAFASGKLDVNDSNLAQAQSGFGQVGAVALTLYLLTGLLVLFIFKTNQAESPQPSWIVGLGLLIVVGSVFNGKRQGLIETVVLLLCCSTIATGEPSNLIGSFLPFRTTRRSRMWIVLLVLFLIPQLISGLLSIRTGGAVERSALDEVRAYYEYPAINMDEQIDEAGGFGPELFRPLGLLKSMIPSKSTLRDSDLLGSDPPAVEPSSPSGFYQHIQWDTGIYGIVFVSVLIGAISQLCYRLAYHHFSALMIYGIIAWALFSAPLYNHFFNLLFLPLPAAIFGFGAWTLKRVSRSVRG